MGKSNKKKAAALKAVLDKLVEEFSSQKRLDNDPLRFPHRYKAPLDREVAALFSALMAWGKRSIILAKLEDLFERMGPSPGEYVLRFRPGKGGSKKLSGFAHRTYSEKDIAGLAVAIRRAVRAFGSLEGLFDEGLAASMEKHRMDGGIKGDLSFSSNPEILREAMAFFVAYLEEAAARAGFPLVKNMLADPMAGSACKRLNMFMRWMVRDGEFDLGMWTAIGPESLVAPLDVIVGRVARRLGWTERKSDDWRAAVEITGAMARLRPEDPLRYDFALSQLGCPPTPAPDKCDICVLRDFCKRQG